MNYNFIFGSLIYRNSKDQDGDDDHEYDYEIVCKLEIFAHAFCMRATFDNRPIWAAAAAAVAARSIHSSNIKHTYNMTNSCTLTSRPSQADTYTYKCTHTHIQTQHMQSFCCGCCCVRVKTRGLCGFGFGRWRESYQHWNNFLLLPAVLLLLFLLPKPKKILKLNTHIKMPCNKRSEEASGHSNKIKIIKDETN